MHKSSSSAAVGLFQLKSLFTVKCLVCDELWT